MKYLQLKKGTESINRHPFNQQNDQSIAEIPTTDKDI